MKWLRPTIVKLNNLRAFPSLYRGYSATRVSGGVEHSYD